MKKDYLQPDAEYISLLVQEEVTTGDGEVDAEIDVESSIF